MHHADSYLEPIVEDMAEIGVDIWQGVLNTNNIAAISQKVGDRMLLMGGIDSVIDREDATEEEIRKETRRAWSRVWKPERLLAGDHLRGTGNDLSSCRRNCDR